MNTALWQPHEYGVHYARCWVLSILLHGTAIGVAIMLLSDLHLAAHPETFRWQVSVVGRTRPSAVQATTAAPMDSRGASPTPVTPSVNESASVAVPTLPARMAARQRQPVEKQTQSALQAIHSRYPAPPTTAPADPSPSTPSETVTSGPSLSELPPSAASSVPTEEPAVSPSRDVSLDTPPAVAPTPTPEMSSSTGHSPNHSSSIQEAAIHKPDFSWLTDSLRSRVQQSQKYSTVARLNGLEGRVVLRITVKDNGELLIAVATSSGHALLDQDAVEQVQRLSPLPLLQPLGRNQRVLNLPIIYSLNR